VALKYDRISQARLSLLPRASELYRATHSEKGRAEHDIIVLESPPLAKGGYFTVPSWNQQIPQAVSGGPAQVLAYVFQLRQYRAGQGKRPGPMPKRIFR